MGTGVREFCRAPRPCKTPLPTLVFICPPVLLPSRRSKGKRLFWFRVTAELPWTPGLPSAHAIPRGPTRSLARITCPWPPQGGRGTSVFALPKTPPSPPLPVQPAIPVTQNEPPAPLTPAPPTSKYYYSLYKGLSVDQRMAMTSMGG